MGLLRKLLIDEGGSRSQVDSYARKVERMHGPKAAAKGGSRKAPAPRTCGQRCRKGYTCTSTVRGGHCPCPDC